MGLRDVGGVLESEDIVLSKIGKSRDYWHRPSISDSSQRRTYSKNDSEIVKKPVENWRALLDAALSSQNVDLMIRDQYKPLPPEDSDWVSYNPFQIARLAYPKTLETAPFSGAK
jgi:hypothetical protein